ncbi:MAG: hypothetical protein AAGA30_04540, partial [Planctomycetota bacterium]
MKFSSWLTNFATAIVIFANAAVSQEPIIDDRVIEITGHVYNPFATQLTGPLTPELGNNFTIAPGIGGIDPTNPSLGNVFIFAGTGEFVDAIMDGEADQIAEDFQNLFDGSIAANPIEVDEVLCVNGKDENSGRFIVTLTLSVNATTQDTTMFPLDPDGLTFDIDLDKNGSDETVVLEDTGLFLGTSAGGQGITFDAAAGVPVTQLALWELRGFDGELVDTDDDGVANGPFNITGFSAFNCP